MTRRMSKDGWDAILAREGGKFGLADLRWQDFNKLINDAFYIGKQNGVEVLVKCSSVAPDSLVNEHKMLERCRAADPDVCPRPLGFWMSPDGTKAFQIQELLPGPELKQLLPEGKSRPWFAADMVRMAEALGKAGIAHRDVSIWNMTCGADGHLRLFDFQFAVDAARPQRDKYLKNNPKYHYCTFGVEDEAGLGVWDDAGAFLNSLASLPPSPERDCAEQRLAEMRGKTVARLPPDLRERLTLGCYKASLRIQRLFASGAKRETINRRLGRLSRRIGKA